MERCTKHKKTQYSMPCPVCLIEERDSANERIKELEAEKKSQDEHIELLNQCDDSSTEVIGKMDKELEEKDKRIKELEKALNKKT